MQKICHFYSAVLSGRIRLRLLLKQVNCPFPYQFYPKFRDLKRVCPTTVRDAALYRPAFSDYTSHTLVMPTMQTEIIRLSGGPSDRDIDGRIIRTLSGGGVIVYPTDTFYGLGASGFNAEAIGKVYRIKQRSAAKPLSLVISDLKMISAVAFRIPPLLEDLAAAFWPGPLTLVLTASPDLPAELLGSHRTIGIRIPRHVWLRKLIHSAGFPLTATSANLSGMPESADPSHVIRMFDGRVDMIIDGGFTPGGLPSTVVDLIGAAPKIVREGAVTRARLQSYLR